MLCKKWSGRSKEWTIRISGEFCDRIKTLITVRKENLAECGAFTLNQHLFFVLFQLQSVKSSAFSPPSKEHKLQVGWSSQLLWVDPSKQQPEHLMMSQKPYLRVRVTSDQQILITSVMRTNMNTQTWQSGSFFVSCLTFKFFLLKFWLKEAPDEVTWHSCCQLWWFSSWQHANGTAFASRVSRHADNKGASVPHRNQSERRRDTPTEDVPAQQQEMESGLFPPLVWPLLSPPSPLVLFLTATASGSRSDAKTSGMPE